MRCPQCHAAVSGAYLKQDELLHWHCPKCQYVWATRVPEVSHALPK